MPRRKRSDESFEHIRRIASHPDTQELFLRADREPYVKSLEVKEDGIRMEFQALHPKWALRLLDVFEALRAEQEQRQAAEAVDGG